MCVTRADIETLQADLAELRRRARRRQARAQGIDAHAVAEAFGRRVALLDDTAEYLASRADMLELQFMNRVVPVVMGQR